MLIDSVWKIGKSEKIRHPNGGVTICGNVRFDPDGKIFEYAYNLHDRLLYIHDPADELWGEHEIYYVWRRYRGCKFMLFPLDYSFTVEAREGETFGE